MAQNIIRPFPLYFRKKKVAEIQTGTYDITPGDEEQIGAEGVLGYSDGATVTKIETDCIVPVRGMKSRIIDALLKKQYAQVGVMVDGQFHQIDMRVTHGTYSWDHKTGRAMGKFTFSGGEPDVTG